MGRVGLLDRPVVDEARETLIAAMQRRWPELRLREPSFRVVPTHDMDHPLLDALLSPKAAARRTLSAIRHGRAAEGLRDAKRWLSVRAGARLDRWLESFRWTMDEAEAVGIRGEYYWMAADHSEYDAGYDPAHPAVRALLAEVAARGHVLGFHPGYASSTNDAIWHRELARLQRAAAPARIVGGRQHYLRLRRPDGLALWAASDLEFDSSLGFADRAGFRCGTCTPFQPVNRKARAPYAVLERPLIVMDMDVSLLSESYENLTLEAAAVRGLTLREACRRVGGEFVFLWHTSRLDDPGARDLYRCLLRC